MKDRSERTDVGGISTEKSWGSGCRRAPAAGEPSRSRGGKGVGAEGANREVWEEKGRGGLGGCRRGAFPLVRGSLPESARLCVLSMRVTAFGDKEVTGGVLLQEGHHCNVVWVRA